MQLFNNHEQLHLNDDGTSVIESHQHIGDDYFDDLKDMTDNFSFRLNGLTPVASIPQQVVDRWIREGFPFWEADAREIQRKLRSEQMDRMIVSGDKTF